MRTKISKTERAEEQQQSKEYLLKHLKPGSRVYTIVKHVSKSGMSRRILCLIVANGKIVDISSHVATLIECPHDPDKGILVGGCGMNMCFHTVYSLGCALFPDGFIPSEAGKTCGRNGASAKKLDTDGGYALEYTLL